MWGIILLTSSTILNTTAIYFILLLVGGSMKAAGLLFLMSSFLAILAIFKSFTKRRYNVYMFLLQQFLLMLSAFWIVMCIYNGHFADKAMYPRQFITVDQLAYILLAIGHSFSLYYNYIFNPETIIC